MPIRAYLGDSCVFDPEAIEAMSAAFEQACADLHVSAGDRRSREVIAARIIDLARNGAVDASVLHRRVVTEAGLGA